MCKFKHQIVFGWTCTTDIYLSIRSWKYEYFKSCADVQSLKKQINLQSNKKKKISHWCKIYSVRMHLAHWSKELNILNGYYSIEDNTCI